MASFTWFRLIFLLSLIFICLQCVDSETLTIRKKKGDDILDIFVVKETVKKHFKDIWVYSDGVYELHENTTGDIMNEYWNKLFVAFTAINDLVKYFDRKVQRAQPQTLMNVIFYTESIEELDKIANTPTDDPPTNWHVRFLELSSLMTQANWFYNKRIYDILQANKYLNSVADSIQHLYGYPWIAPISVKKGANVTSRMKMREFWHLSAELVERTRLGDIFYGIRKLIDENAAALGTASFDSDACTNQNFGQIVPIRFDAPLYVYYYFALFHVKMFIIRNFNFVFQQVYAGIVVPGKEKMIHDFMEAGVAIAMDHYNNSFWNYTQIYAPKMQPVMKGYFMCDPEEPNFIEVTNFYNIFLTPQINLQPNCDTSCNQIGSADSSSVDCINPKTSRDKQFCANLPCPLDQIKCYNDSAPSAVICPSSYPNQLYDWFTLGDTHFGPQTKCKEPLISMHGEGINKTKSEEESNKLLNQYKKSHKKEKSNGKKKNTAEFTDTRGEEEEEQITTTTTEESTRANSGEIGNCNVCMCKCASPIEINGQKGSIRVFSLRQVIANIKENRVVVGAKFEKVYDQIHLMIADAEMAKRGYYVNMSTVEWQRVTPVDPGNAEESVTLGKDLRHVYLQSWKVKPKHVITGLRFVHSKVKQDNETKEGYIGIQVMQTKIDEDAGIVSNDEDASSWLQADKDFTHTPRYAYGDPDTPLNLDGISLPDSSAEQLIEFRETSLKKHAGQTVVPFFDSQQVIFPKKPYALKGIGVYHRHKVGFGGFLAFKLLPYEDKHLKMTR